MAIQAVIFDLGGVIVRTEDHRPRAELAADYDFSYSEIARLVFDSPTAGRATLGQIESSAHWKAVGDNLGLSAQEANRFQARFFAGDRLDEELVNEIRALRSQYQTALLSNAWDNLRHLLEVEWKIADAFDFLFISAELGIAKPHPDIYQHVLSEMAVEPDQVVFVDDFIENIQTARQVGIHGIHFQSPDQARRELKALLDCN